MVSNGNRNASGRPASRPARIAGAALAASFALVTQRTAASAVTSPSPIAVNDCRISNTRAFVSTYRPVALVFTNHGSVPANEIRFSVEYAGHTEHIIDKGTFAQNVRIEHTFSGFYNVRFDGSSPRCSVDYVEFVDGSVWTPPRQPERPLPCG